MTITSILATLGIQIILAQNASIPCGTEANGCYSEKTQNNKIISKTIFLGFNSDNMNRTLIHETGHALYLHNEKAREIIKKYPPIRNFCTPKILEMAKIFPAYGDCLAGYTAKQILDENVADYYVLYRTDIKFKEKYPELYEFYNSIN